MKKSRLIVLSLLVLIGACNIEQTPINSQDEGTRDDVTITLARERIRMSPAQLSKAVQTVTGGMTWQSSNEEDLFQRYSASLGQADYVESTRSDFSASSAFHKFMRDAAESVCDTWLDLEASGEREQNYFLTHARKTDTLERNPERINANLSELMLRFYGRQIDSDSSELEPFRFLFTGALSATQDPLLAWKTVCVGLFSHPAFYTY